MKRPKKILTAEEKEDAKIKRAMNKMLRENRTEWQATLPKPWVEGASPFHHPIMFKSDAKKAFSLTEEEILTLRHESIPASSIFH
ncbi:hypothetical protein C8R44DRAFT_878734 [Mycena epipterygia]|nr:hypothetical protein C8R44DRAFT_878734 [Mycena epipterygia]